LQKGQALIRGKEKIMPHIQVLDQITIDKIAAGEVIERPSSIVKELAENAIDANATSVIVEIQEGGISLIRITDNGIGMLREDVRNAFLRHSTSKIRSVEDLSQITSLGFRGEALSSIAAVTKVELITKTKQDTFGTRYIIEGGEEQLLEDTGAPDGTTFLIRQLFYNVPARRKFLKTSMTEAGHIQDLLMRLALSHPEVSFQFINNGQEKLRTAGNGKLKDVIYSIYGRETAANLIEMNYEKGGLQIKGYLGRPAVSRGNRNFENLFVNGRYIKSAMMSKAIEDAYRDYVMQHKFPFLVLHFQISGEDIDVNVHPTKMELRFQNQQTVYNTLYEGVHRTLLEPELIPVVEVPNPPERREEKPDSPFLLKPRVEPGRVTSSMPSVPEKIQYDQRTKRKTEEEKLPESQAEPQSEQLKNEEYFIRKMKERVVSFHQSHISEKMPECEPIQSDHGPIQPDREPIQSEMAREEVIYQKDTADIVSSAPEQMNLFDEKLLKREVKAEYKLIGQVFDTYWLVEFHDSLYIIDQHAAHERVLYERTLREMKNREFTSQYLSPPVILSLSMQEAQLLNEHMERFVKIGFEIEPFGGDEYAVRAVPDNLFSIAKKELLMEMLDDLCDGLTTSMTPELIDEKVASMSCKAAVKGNSRLTSLEVDALIGELLVLENPYHCPHGRPTIIAMTKRELEKKFKRIV
jgi:DNA mismatch repair protein MutL